jgi:hypothetical protein
MLAALVSRTASAGWLLVLALASGCLGGQTGTEQINAEGTGGNADSPCVDHEEPVSPDDTSLGFSANDAFDFVVGSHQTELAWGSALPSVSFGPESGVVGLELEVTASGDVRRVTSVPRASSGEEGPTIGIVCSGRRLEADVTLRLVTASGALDETVPALLTIADGEFASLTANIELDAIKGSFMVTSAPGVQTDSLSVRALFSKDGHAGVLTGSFQTSSGGAASQSSIGYGRWPASSPCSAGYEPVIAAPLPSSLLQALELLTATVPEPLRWSSGTNTTVSFAATAQSSSACVTPPSLGGASTTTVPLDVAIRTADGRLDTTLPGELTAAGDTTAELRAWLACSGETPEAQASSCGLSGVDVGAHTFVSLSLSASITQANGIDGELTVMGVPPTTCEPTPNSACGSPGASPIESGRF